MACWILSALSLSILVCSRLRAYSHLPVELHTLGAEELILPKPRPQKAPTNTVEVALRREAAAPSTAPARLAILVEEGVTLARLVARNSSSPPALLEKLGSHSDPGVRKWVARNANTSAQVAVRLGAQFPQQILENPAFDLYLLEHPDLLEKIGIGALRSILRRNTCPQGLFEYAVGFGDEITQLSILQNAAAPKSVVERLAQSPHSVVRDAVAMHVSISKEMKLETVRKRFEAALVATGKEAKPTPMHNALAYLLALPAPNGKHSAILSSREQMIIETAEPDTDVRCAVAINPATPVPVLEKLALDQNPHVRQKVTANGSTPVELLDKLSKDHDSKVRRSIVWNPLAPLFVLWRLAEDPDEWVRLALADYRSTPVEILDKLSTDQHKEVRRSLARNPSAPLSALRHLAKDLEEIVRINVGRNPSTPVEFLDSLSQDQSRWIRIAVSENPSAPVAILERLVTDLDHGVRYAVVENPSTPVAVLEKLAMDTAEWVSRNAIERLSTAKTKEIDWPHPTAPVRVRSTPTKDQDKANGRNVDQNASMAFTEAVSAMIAVPQNRYLRWVVAESQSTPVPVLKKLAWDRSQDVRQAVAANPSAPVSVLKLLATDQHAQVRQGVAKNFSTPMAILTKLARDKNRNVRLLVARNRSASAALLAHLARDNDASVRSKIVEHPAAPVTVLRTLAADKSALVRCGVAEHPSTPVTILKILAKDKSALVRRKVVKHPSAPLAVLAILAKDRSEDVRWHVERKMELIWQKSSTSPNTKLAVLKNLAMTREVHIRRKIAENGSTPATLLKTLAKDEDPEVRRAVAERHSTPATVLKMLSTDQDPRVRQAVARQRSTSENTLKTLATDPDQSVRYAIAENPSTPPHTLQFLACCVETALEVRDRCAAALCATNKKVALAALRQEILTSLTGPAIGSYSRLLGFLLPDCPVASLARAQRSSSWLERCAIALHPASPISALQHLAGDGNTMVRSAAVERLKGMQAQR